MEEPREISRMEVERPASRSARSEGTGVTGPSFLGLSDAGDDGGDEDGYSRPYGDDLYRSNWGARFLFALIVIGVVGGLGYMQLKSNHPLQAILGTQPAANTTAANGQANDSAARPNASEPSAPENQNANGSTTGATANSTPSAQSSDTAETSLKGEAADQAPATAKDKTAEKTAASGDSWKTNGAASAEKSDKSADQKQAGDASDKSESAPSDQEAIPANSGNDKQPTSTKSKSKSAKVKNSSDEESAPSADDSSSESDASDATAAAPARAVDNSEEPVRQAEIYLEGKGVPQNCDEGVGILRAAEARGNSRALVKLGAIYATGNCVPKDNAIAYHYFTRAHAVDPKNEWVEENRAILWANMTEDERARVRTEDGSIE